MSARSQYINADRTVKVRVEVDSDDALRKLREVGREALRTRRAVDGRGLFGNVFSLITYLVGVVYGMAGVLRHDTYSLGCACVFLLVTLASER